MCQNAGGMCQNAGAGGTVINLSAPHQSQFKLRWLAPCSYVIPFVLFERSPAESQKLREGLLTTQALPVGWVVYC